MATPQLEPGRNIAMKIPPHQYESVVKFYRDVLHLRQLEMQGPGVVLDFGGKSLWLDKADALSQAEVWLEIRADDVEAAAEYFRQHGVARRDEVEALPDGFQGFWIANPAGIIHLVSGA